MWAEGCACPQAMETSALNLAPGLKTAPERQAGSTSDRTVLRELLELGTCCGEERSVAGYTGAGHGSAGHECPAQLLAPGCFPAVLSDPGRASTRQLQRSQERGQGKRSPRHISLPGDGEILPSTPSPTPG